MFSAILLQSQIAKQSETTLLLTYNLREMTASHFLSFVKTPDGAHGGRKETQFRFVIDGCHS